MTINRFRHLEKELQEFCNNYLIDLVDIGFKIDVNYVHQYYHIELVIWKTNKRLASSFKWKDVKDSFLPFFEMLQLHYKLSFQIINKEPKYLEFSRNRYFHKSEVNDDINISSTDYIKILIQEKI